MKPITESERREFQTLRTYWQDRLPAVSNYQHFVWLRLYRMDALKEAVRCTKRWFERTPEATEDEMIRYFSATARNINAAMDAVDQVDNPVSFNVEEELGQ